MNHVPIQLFSYYLKSLLITAGNIFHTQVFHFPLNKTVNCTIYKNPFISYNKEISINKFLINTIFVHLSGFVIFFSGFVLMTQRIYIAK